jgi:hypothetical protein
MMGQWHAGKFRPPGARYPVRLASKQGALTGKQAADARALALLPTIRELIATGFATDHRLVDELNRKGITGARGGRWYRSSLRRLLTRLRQLTSKHGGTDNSLAVKRVADLRAGPYSPTIRKLRKAGFVSGKAIAHELNARGIPTAGGSKWHPTTATRLLRRLDRLDRVSRSRR